MINKYIKSLLLIGALIVLASCFPDALKEIGEPFSKKEGIVGDWRVISVTQIDEIAKKDGEIFFSMDLTDLFGFYEFEISFNADGTFGINENPSPLFVDLRGTWSFEDEEFPKEVLLTAQDADEVTSKFVLHKTPAPGRDLEIKFQRVKDNEVVLSYIYKLAKKINK